MEKYWKLWRKDGALVILLLQIFAMCINSDILLAFVMPLWLTVPCGIKAVNVNWYLWYPRQLMFGIFAVIAVYQLF